MRIIPSSQKNYENQKDYNLQVLLKLSKFYNFEWTSVVSVGLAEEHRHFLSVPILETAARFLSRKTVSTNSRFLAPAVRQKKAGKCLRSCGPPFEPVGLLFVGKDNYELMIL